MVEKTRKNAHEIRGQQAGDAADTGDDERGNGYLELDDFDTVLAEAMGPELGYSIYALIEDQASKNRKVLKRSGAGQALEGLQDEPGHAQLRKRAVAEAGLSFVYWSVDDPTLAEAERRRHGDMVNSASIRLGEDIAGEIRCGLLIPFAAPAGRIYVVEYYGNAPRTDHERLSLVNATLFYLMDKVRAAGRGPAEQMASLSRKELECLRWAADGKTSSEIAIITGLSEHTVNHYLIFACNKLNAVNRAHAVAKAIRAGII